MTKRTMRVVSGMMAGFFLWGSLPAYAVIPGLRAARTAIAAKKAKEKLAESQQTKASGTVKTAPGDAGTEAAEAGSSKRRGLLGRVFGNNE